MKITIRFVIIYKLHTKFTINEILLEGYLCTYMHTLVLLEISC